MQFLKSSELTMLVSVLGTKFAMVQCRQMVMPA